MRRPLGWLAVLLVLLVCAGCALPVSGSPQRIADSDVPFGLLATTPPGAQAATRGPNTLVYFVRNDHLVGVRRHVASLNGPADALRLLLRGPTEEEAAQGLASDVPAPTHLISLDVTNTTATVDLSSEFGNVGGSDQVLAVAQIVYTLTASPSIDAVSFAVNGKPVEVPDGSGSLSSLPMSRSDYHSLLSSSS